MKRRDIKTLFAALRMYQAGVVQFVDERIDAKLGELADTIHYADDKPGPLPAPPQVLCAAKTRGDLPCTHYARRGGWFCRFHSGQDPFTHAADVIDREAEERRIAEFVNALVDKLGLDKTRVAGVLRRLADGCSSPTPNRRGTPPAD